MFLSFKIICILLTHQHQHLFVWMVHVLAASSHTHIYIYIYIYIYINKKLTIRHRIERKIGAPKSRRDTSSWIPHSLFSYNLYILLFFLSFICGIICFYIRGLS
jgi:hypothetical protein